MIEKLQVDPAERGELAATILAGVERCYDRQGRRGRTIYRATEGELLRDPYLLGYGAVEVVRHPTLSLATRLRAVAYVLDRIEPDEDDGVPYGLLAILGFMASVGRLDAAALCQLVQIADLAGDMYDGLAATEATTLLDWIATASEIPDDERRWWLWYLLAHCEDIELGRQMFAAVVRQPALAVELRRELCHAFLEQRRTGKVPALWRAWDAIWMGDIDGLRAAVMELPPEQAGKFSELLDEWAADQAGKRTRPDARHTEAPDNLWALMLAAEDDGPSRRFAVSNLLRKSALFQFGDSFLTPAYLKGQAVTALPRLGEDPLQVAERYLDSQAYDADAVNLGIAELLREHAPSISSEVMRAQIARGLTIGKVRTRKGFYRLGMELFGHEYLELARRDNANSIREWAKEGGQAERGRQRRRGRRAG